MVPELNDFVSWLDTYQSAYWLIFGYNRSSGVNTALNRKLQSQKSIAFCVNPKNKKSSSKIQRPRFTKSIDLRHTVSNTPNSKIFSRSLISSFPNYIYAAKRKFSRLETLSSRLEVNSGFNSRCCQKCIENLAT